MEAAVQVEAVSYLRTAQRYAASVLPPSVRTLLDLHREINSIQVEDVTLTRDGHKLENFYLAAHNTVLVTTRRQLQLLESANMIHADATYKVVARRFGCQLFTVHGNWNGFVSNI